MANIPKYSRLNCYFRCRAVDLLHHFPHPERDSERFESWKVLLDDDVKEMGNEYIYNQLRYCNIHFESFYKSGRRLTRNAVPTLFITDSRKTDSTSSQENDVPSTSNESSGKVDSVVLEDSINIRKRKCMTDACVSLSVTENPSTSTDSLSLPSVLKVVKDTKRKRKPAPVQKTNFRIKRLSDRVMKLTQKCRSQTKKIQAAKKMSETNSFMKAIEGMPDSMQTFMKLQLKFNKKSRGRKFTLEEKIMATAIMKQSPKAYNFLKKLVVLPSKRTVQRLLSSYKIKPGVNHKIIAQLQEAVRNLPVEKRLYTLLFDEVALSPGMHFNKTDIIGFENYGETNTKNIADHALVLMIKGIKTKAKQPILFTFCKGSTKKNELKKIMVETIIELKKAGIIIIATICDQAQTNVGMIKLLQTETKEKYLRNGEDYNSYAFEVDDSKIFPLFDTPHLLKGVRNNFITKNIRYIQNGQVKVAKWEHLRMLLNEDRGEDEIRILNKLTEYHIDPQKIPKMKVKYAAQVFSQRVSAVMRFLSSRKILPAECEDTANLLLLFDKLFDSFNGHSYRDTAKALKGCLKNNSNHFQFWAEVLPILKSMEFQKLTKHQDGTEVLKYEKVPSVQNWIHNIGTFKEMWNYISKEFKVTNVTTRSFNQDPLENFFSCIRSNGVRNVNPTCLQFMNAYKTLLINNMNSPHSIHANCEKDDYQQLQSMSFLLNENDSIINTDFVCEVDSLIITMNEIVSQESIVHEEAKKYVAGYLIKKCKTKIFKNCKSCANDLLNSEVDYDSFNYMIDYTKKSLFNACDDFIKLLNEIYFMIITCLRESPEIMNLRDKIIFFINCRCDFSLMKCNKHKLVLVDFLINESINLVVNSWCTGVNRILVGKIVDFDKNDHIKLQAFNYNKTHKRKK